MTAAPPQVVGRARPPQTPAAASSAPSTASASTSERAKTEGTGRRHPPSSQNGPVKLKVVVRGLPSNLPEAVFKQSAKEWINESTVDWYYYVAGKLYERGNKPNIRSRAYAKFKSLEYLVAFHKAFNGHVFTDSKGSPISVPQNRTYRKGRSSRAIIEFAPYQKSIKGKIKPDSKQGTIESSPEYKEFLESLAQPASAPVDLAIPMEEEPKTTTPLIEFLRNQKATKAEKERLAREKDKARKIAALQAKANAQSAKFRAEKLAKTAPAAALNEAARVTKPETPKTANARGGRTAAVAGGKGPGRLKEKPKLSPQAQPPRQQPPKHQEPNRTAEASKSCDMIPNPTAVVSPAASISASEIPSNTGGQTHRGGRGRGRARPHGIYRPGGRGGRRGGASGPGNESRPGATAGGG